MARGYSGAVRPQAQRALRLPAALRALPARPGRLAPLAAGRQPRPARPARLRRLPLLLQPGRDRRLGAAAVPGAALPARRGRCGSGSAAGARGCAPVWPAAWLLVAALFLMGFRVGLNVADSGAIDVGYASVVGADRIAHGEPIYDNFPEDVSQGDTYGPVNYFAYVPFERIWPWSGSWDDLPAAHGAAVVFDLAHLRPADPARHPHPPRTRRPPPRRDPRLRLGRLPLHRLRPRVELQRHPGRACSWSPPCWSCARPLARGAAGGRSPPSPSSPRPCSRRCCSPTSRRQPPDALLFAAGLRRGLASRVAALARDRPRPADRSTTARSPSRPAATPRSASGVRCTSLEPLRIALLAATGALSLAPRLPPPPQVPGPGRGALGAALLIALQITLHHWFYLYIVWFFPLLLVALAAVPSRRLRALEPEPEPSPARSSRPAPVG